MTDSRMLWDYDVRVRDRNLKAGRISKEDVKRHLDNAADRANNVDSLDLAQPALAGPEPLRVEAVEEPAPPPPVAPLPPVAPAPFMPVAVAPVAAPAITPPFAAAPAYPDPAPRPVVAAPIAVAPPAPVPPVPPVSDTEQAVSPPDAEDEGDPNPPAL